LGRKTVTVLLSGWALGTGVWAFQENCFSEGRVLKIDYHHSINNALPGSGPSMYAAAALDRIKVEAGERVILIGWSLGTLVALELAGLAAGKIVGMVLVGGTARFAGHGDYNCGLPRILVERMKRKLAKNCEKTLEGFYSEMFSPEEREKGLMERFRKEILSQGSGWSKEELLAGLNFLLHRDLRGKLAGIDIPTLIIHGDKDEICPLPAGRYLHENLRGSQFRLLPGCGHMPFFSKAEVFNETVGRWIYGLD